eukprot:2187215-Rhodomonas_salina.6
MPLCSRYAISSADLGYAPTRSLCISSTDLAYAATRLLRDARRQLPSDPRSLPISLCGARYKQSV